MTASKPMRQRLDEIMSVLKQEADLDGLVTVSAHRIGEQLGLSANVIQIYLRLMAKQEYFESYVASSKTGYVIQLKGY